MLGYSSVSWYFRTRWSALSRTTSTSSDKIPTVTISVCKILWCKMYYQTRMRCPWSLQDQWYRAHPGWSCPPPSLVEAGRRRSCSQERKKCWPLFLKWQCNKIMLLLPIWYEVECDCEWLWLWLNCDCGCTRSIRSWILECNFHARWLARSGLE